MSLVRSVSVVSLTALLVAGANEIKHDLGWEYIYGILNTSKKERYSRVTS